MTVKYKPIFQCDGCSLEFEDPDKVRIFESLVKNGDQTKQYIETGMFCLDCIPLALDFKNENPETIKIIEPIKALAATDPHKEIYSAINDIQDNIDRFEELIENHKHITPDHDHVKILELYDKIQKLEVVKSYNENTMKEEWDVKDITPKETIQEEPIETTNQEPQEEPETINEINNSETDDVLDNFGEDKGTYLILKLIDNESAERKFAQKNNYKDVKDLRATCGNKPLIGLYYSINRFVDDPNDIGEFDKQANTKIINKIFFGVPSIVERNIYMYNDVGLALIEKDQFNDKIEAIKYEIPKEPDIEIPDEHEIEIPEIHQDIEPRKTVKSMLDKFTNEVFQKPSKKTFSSRNIGDEYI